MGCEGPFIRGTQGYVEDPDCEREQKFRQYKALRRRRARGLADCHRLRQGIIAITSSARLSWNLDNFKEYRTSIIFKDTETTDQGLNQDGHRH